MKLKKVLKEIRSGRMVIRNDNPDAIKLLVMYFSEQEVRGSEPHYRFVSRSGELRYGCVDSTTLRIKYNPDQIIEASKLWQRIHKKSKKKSKVEKLKKRVDKLEEVLRDVDKHLKNHLRDEAHKDNATSAKGWLDVLNDNIAEIVKQRSRTNKLKFPPAGVISPYVGGEYIVHKNRQGDDLLECLKAASSMRELAEALRELSKSMKETPKKETKQETTAKPLQPESLPEGWKMEELVPLFDRHDMFKAKNISKRTGGDFEDVGAFLIDHLEFAIVKDSVGSRVLIARNKKK